MKKFEALERVQQHTAARADGDEAGGIGEAAGASGSAPAEGAGVLTEEQLLEVFKQTSVFTVRSALAGQDSMHHYGARRRAAARARTACCERSCRTRRPGSADAKRAVVKA